MKSFLKHDLIKMSNSNWKRIYERREEDGQKVIFADLIHILGGIDAALYFLNTEAINKVVFYIRDNGTIWTNGGAGTKVLKYEKSPIDNHFAVYMSDGLGSKGKGMIYFDKIEIPDFQKFKKIERLDIDPYGEEDWGWEKIGNIKENVIFEDLLHNTILTLKTQVEYDLAMEQLEKYGYMWSLNNLPTSNNFFQKYLDFCIIINNKYLSYANVSWCRNHREFKYYKHITIEDLYQLKNFKKIKNPEIDPYGEEDWGWEEIEGENDFGSPIKERFEAERYTVDHIKNEDIQTLLDIKYEDFKHAYDTKESHDSYARKFVDVKTSLKLMDGDKIIGGYILYPTTIKEEFNGWLNIDDFLYDVTPLLNKKGVVGFSLFIDKKYRKKGLGQMLIDHVMNDTNIDFMMGYAYHSLGNISHWLKRRYLLMDVVKSESSFYITIETKGIKLNISKPGKIYADKHPNLNWGKKQRGFIKENINETKIDQRFVSFFGGRNIFGVIHGEMNGNNERNRNRILDTIKPHFGKKFRFTNEKDGSNRKKDRIIKGAYWEENSGDWNLMLIGTKKDYKVNLNSGIGYYDKYNISKNLELDPYGEEEWEMNESKKRLKKEDIKVGDIVRHLRSKKIGKVVITNVFGNSIVINFGRGFTTHCDPSELEHYKPKQIFSEDDPYGEEDWGE